MKLINPHKVDFEEVLQTYKNVHKNSLSLNPDLFNYDLNLLERANDFFAFWIKADISIEDTKELVLPYYIDKDSGEIIVPIYGERLFDAHKRLLIKNQCNFKKNSPVCFNKIMTQEKLIKEKGAGTFLFSQGPFTEEYGTYGQINYGDNDLVHLDGFHRLLALTNMPYNEKLGSIKSYIAAKEIFFDIFKNE